MQEKQKPDQTGQRFYYGSDNFQGALLPALKESMEKAQSIDLIVSFIMESGVRLLVNDLKAAARRGARIRILCGNYLGITDPTALTILYHELPDSAELRLYSEARRSFHPKSYLFTYEDGSQEAFIGSSNLSRSALQTGIEWNYRILEAEDPQNFQTMRAEFERLFDRAVSLNEESIAAYQASWIRPKVLNTPEFADDLPDTDRPPALESKPEPPKKTHPDDFELSKEAWKAKAEKEGQAGNSDASLSSLTAPQPRGAQTEALYALQETRANGSKKALIQAATGVGKTYLAAFDSKPYKKILFVAHRKEILEQVAKTFRHVRPEARIGLLDQNHKDLDADILMASVFTLCSEQMLDPAVLAPDAFAYMVVDEFHHAAAGSYQKILEYFQPQFLLGLSATPERLDGRNVYALCDFNVPYSIDLKTAINRGLLVPFHYYALFDSTDYSVLRRQNGKYKTEDLEKVYAKNRQRSMSILRNYRKYGSRQAIGFCASKAHARMMAAFFNEQNVPSAFVYSGSASEAGGLGREEALQQLKTGEKKVLFTVDLFNEGLDIDTLDMVLFLRPTESPTIFLQQLGRGLRLSPGKEYLNVLDFIGNYEQAFLGPALLSGLPYSKLQAAEIRSLTLPEGCLSDFDLDLIDLFEKMPKPKPNYAEWKKQEYFRIKEMLHHRPSRQEYFENVEDELLEKLLKEARLNPFRDYLGFLKQLDELRPSEEILYDSFGGQFLRAMEQTPMDHVYKAPILLSFLDETKTKLLPELSEEKALASWKQFFAHNENWRDFSTAKKPMTYTDFLQKSDAWHLAKIKGIRRPVYSLLKSESRYFQEKDGFLLALSDELSDWLNDPLLVLQFQEIVNLRVELYYYRRFRPAANEKM